MTKTFSYTPIGVCSKRMDFEIENNTIKKVTIIGGCPGNLEGICKLLVGMDIDDAINKLKDIKCGMKKTSCPDQIAQALEKNKSLN